MFVLSGGEFRLKPLVGKGWRSRAEGGNLPPGRQACHPPCSMAMAGAF